MAEILIVDDTFEMRDLLRRSIANAFPKASLTDVGSGNDAIKSLQALQFDLVICDFTMGNGSGLDVFQFVDGLADRPHFIMFTGNQTMISSPVWREKFMIVAKPDIEELLHALSFLDISRTG